MVTFILVALRTYNQHLHTVLPTIQSPCQHKLGMKETQNQIICIKYIYYNLVNDTTFTYTLTKINMTPKFLPTHQNSCKIRKYSINNMNKYYEILNRTNFISEHKLLPVNLTWLSQVYGKMFYFPKS